MSSLTLSPSHIAVLEHIISITHNGLPWKFNGAGPAHNSFNVIYGFELPMGGVKMTAQCDGQEHRLYGYSLEGTKEAMKALAYKLFVEREAGGDMQQPEAEKEEENGQQPEAEREEENGRQSEA